MGEAALGVVPVDGRGSLPYALVHGESLVAAASWALSTAGAELFDYTVPFAAVQETGRALAVHDPLCPLTPAAFLGRAIAESEATGAVVVGVRPVTDTVKEYAAPDAPGTPGLVGATLDREELRCVTSPVVLPAAVLAGLEGLSGREGLEGDGLAALVAVLARRFPVQLLQAPPLGRRVVTESDLVVLDALSRATS